MCYVCGYARVRGPGLKIRSPLNTVYILLIEGSNRYTVPRKSSRVDVKAPDFPSPPHIVFLHVVIFV